MTTLNLDMTSAQLHAWIVEHGPVHVVFSQKSEDLECYPEKGIQALITGVKTEWEDVDEETMMFGPVVRAVEMYKWHVDYTPFQVVNTLHESSNYYGPCGHKEAYLRAYATGSYKAKDSLYIGPNAVLSNYIAHVQPAPAQASPDAVEQRFAAIHKALGDLSI